MTLKQYIREIRRLLGRDLTLREERYAKDGHNVYMDVVKCAKLIEETSLRALGYGTGHPPEIE